MKKITGLILTLSIIFNTGIAAFSAPMPSPRVNPVVVDDSARLSVMGSVLRHIEQLSDQVRNSNPLVPNLVPAPADNNSAEPQTAAIFRTSENKLPDIRQSAGKAAPAASGHGLDPQSFGAPRIFPPPGWTSCVNSNYLQNLVFLAKSNLPWAIDLTRKG